MSIPSGRQSQVASARAEDIVLVVWTETEPDGFLDVRGMRLRASGGEPLDATPLCIGCGSGVQQSAAIASNGSDLLVTWSYQALTYGLPGSPLVYGVRVRAADGAVLGTPTCLGSTYGQPWNSRPVEYASAAAATWLAARRGLRTAWP